MFDRWTTVAVAVCCLILLVANIAAADQNIPYEDPAAAAPYYPAGALDCRFHPKLANWHNLHSCGINQIASSGTD